MRTLSPYPVTETPSRRIAGILPAGMLDWPGRVAPTIFLSGCNFTCPYCHNAELLAPSVSEDGWGEVKAYLRRRRSWIDGVVITGGEPASDPDLIPLLTAIADEGLPIKLDTNGSRPDVVERVIADGLVQRLAIDIKTTWERYPEISGVPDVAAAVRQTVAIVAQSGIPHEYRTTVYPGIVAPEDLPEIAAELSGGELYAIQQFRSGQTLDPRADAIEPYNADILRHAASQCDKYLPTITRGA